MTKAVLVKPVCVNSELNSAEIEHVDLSGLEESFEEENLADADLGIFEGFRQFDYSLIMSKENTLLHRTLLMMPIMTHFAINY